LLYCAVPARTRCAEFRSCDGMYICHHPHSVGPSQHGCSSFLQIGQAMRIGQANGMHTDMPVQELGQPLVERCRKIWWTVCVLDRQMTSLMGIPQSIRADEMTCQLPDFVGCPQRRAALQMQIRLSHIYADIARGKLTGFDLRNSQCCTHPKR